jgi:hypothetical protein
MSNDKISIPGTLPPADAASSTNSSRQTADLFMEHVEQLMTENPEQERDLLDEISLIADALHLTEQETGLVLNDQEFWDSVQTMATETLGLLPAGEFDGLASQIREDDPAGQSGETE